MITVFLCIRMIKTFTIFCDFFKSLILQTLWICDFCRFMSYSSFWLYGFSSLVTAARSLYCFYHPLMDRFKQYRHNYLGREALGQPISLPRPGPLKAWNGFDQNDRMGKRPLSFRAEQFPAGVLLEPAPEKQI
jgi:hypothetical protein